MYLSSVSWLSALQSANCITAVMYIPTLCLTTLMSYVVPHSDVLSYIVHHGCDVLFCIVRQGCASGLWCIVLYIASRQWCTALYSMWRQWYIALHCKVRVHFIFQCEEYLCLAVHLQWRCCAETPPFRLFFFPSPMTPISLTAALSLHIMLKESYDCRFRTVFSPLTRSRLRTVLHSNSYNAYWKL